VWKHNRASHDLIRLTGINTKPNRNLNGLIKPNALNGLWESVFKTLESLNSFR
jgi:hypothetical protein